MIQKFLDIGMNEKEAKVYLYLIEYGISAASEMAKHFDFPKSTVNFLADTLWREGYLNKSIRSGTHYYEADITLIESMLRREQEEKEVFLSSVIPLLREMNANVRSKPKIIFFDGVENCKKAYSELLEVQDIFFEFGAHADLVHAFGEIFMDNFIRERVKRNIFCDSIATGGEVTENLHQHDDRDMRTISIATIPFGTIHSSIAIYEDKVLILNLGNTPTAVRIQNREFAETMKTIYMLAKHGI